MARTLYGADMHIFRQQCVMKVWLIFATWALWLGVSNFLPYAQAQERVRAYYPGISGSQIPLFIANDLGFFKKYGLDVDIVFISGAAGTAAQLAGEVQFGVGQSFTTITGALAGADTVIAATYLNKLLYMAFSEGFFNALLKERKKP